MKRCNHNTLPYEWKDDVGVSRHCVVCGALLSLGEADDASLSVQLEIDAAAHMQDLAESVTPRLTMAEAAGFARREDDQFATLRGWQVGWLVSEYVDGEFTGWPWDPTRPVAGQYEEYVAATAPAQVDLDIEVGPKPEHGIEVEIDEHPPVVIDGVEAAEVADFHDEPTLVGDEPVVAPWDDEPVASAELAGAAPTVEFNPGDRVCFKDDGATEFGDSWEVLGFNPDGVVRLGGPGNLESLHYARADQLTPYTGDLP